MIKKITFLCLCFGMLTFLVTGQTLTVTQHPTSVDVNGEATAGPTVYKMEVRDWPINGPIHLRLKLGTDPDGGNGTDFKSGTPDAFKITGPTETNVSTGTGDMTASAVTVGEMISIGGDPVQGYNVDLEWTDWGATDNAPAADGDDVIFGGAGFLNASYSASVKHVIMGATVMSYSAPSESLNLVSVYNAATNGVAENPITTVNRGSTFPVKFTLNTDAVITELTVLLNVVGWSGGWSDQDIASTSYVFNNIPSTGGMDTEFTADLTFPVDKDQLLGGVTWTLDPSGVNSNTSESSLRNDLSTSKSNYRIKIFIGNSQVLDGAGYTDTQILAVTENPLSVEDVSLSHISVYPNPTKGNILISDISDVNNVWIVNSIGLEVKRFDKVTEVLDISDLTSGIYILRSDNGLRRKIVKQ